MDQTIYTALWIVGVALVAWSTIAITAFLATPRPEWVDSDDEVPADFPERVAPIALESDVIKIFGYGSHAHQIWLSQMRQRIGGSRDSA